jgi:hypothetical protein
MGSPAEDFVSSSTQPVSFAESILRQSVVFVFDVTCARGGWFRRNCTLDGVALMNCGMIDLGNGW